MKMISQSLKENNFYRISDLALVAVLSLDLPIEKIDRQNPTKVQFLFAESEQLRRLVDDYWKGQLQVEPKAFFNQLKNIKTRIYSE
jgi:hypothetical protein